MQNWPTTPQNDHASEFMQNETDQVQLDMNN